MHACKGKGRARLETNALSAPLAPSYFSDPSPFIIFPEHPVAPSLTPAATMASFSSSSIRRLVAVIALLALALALLASGTDAKRHEKAEVAVSAPDSDSSPSPPMQAAADDTNRPPSRAASSRMATPFGDGGAGVDDDEANPKAKAATDEDPEDEARAQAAIDRRNARAARRFGAKSGAGGSGDVPDGPTCGGGCNSDMRTGAMLMGRVLQQQLTTDPGFCCQLCQMRGDCGGWNFCAEDGGCATPTAPLPYIKGSCELRAAGGGTNNQLKSWTHGVKDCDGMPAMEVVT